ncbi:hypothetical protein OAL32_00305 [Synechococcus sp. AH-551-G15]|nr:hypothetical protein [Synechococcus sp. AH-551-G15]
MENKQEYNKELLTSYIQQLQAKYDSLASDPFGGKARITLRGEIENVRSILAEEEMDCVWSNLSKAFNMDDVERPKHSYISHQQEEDFFNKMKGQVSIADQF